jgi:hypothetical protein
MYIYKFTKSRLFRIILNYFYELSDCDKEYMTSHKYDIYHSALEYRLISLRSVNTQLLTSIKAFKIMLNNNLMLKIL